MTMRSLTKRLPTRGLLGGAALALASGGAAQAHGDHSVPGMFHMLSHLLADHPILVMIGACAAALVVWKLVRRKDEGEG